MIAFQSIRRRALGDAPRVRHERLVREIHTVRTFANSLYAAGASFLFVEADAPLVYLGWAWFVSLVLPSVFTFFALRSSSPQAFIIKSMLAECGVVAVVYLASGFSTFVVFWGALLMAINALMTAGTIAGVVGLFHRFEIALPEQLSVLLVPLLVDQGEEQVFLGRDLGRRAGFSQATLLSIDNEVRTIVEEGHNWARSILAANIHILHKIAQILLEKETLEGDEFRRVVLGMNPVLPEGIGSVA